MQPLYQDPDRHLRIHSALLCLTSVPVARFSCFSYLYSVARRLGNTNENFELPWLKIEQKIMYIQKIVNSYMYDILYI